MSPGQVKIILASRFRSELGFIKSANLAGLMISRLWVESTGQNHAQRSISILLLASSYLFRTYGNQTDIASYLWCHQKASGKKGWFFRISSDQSSIRRASVWYFTHARQLAKELGEEAFFQRLNRNWVVGDDVVSEIERLLSKISRS
jgi:hypothetical protein